MNIDTVNQLLADFDAVRQHSKVDFAGYAQNWLREHPELVEKVAQEIIWLKSSSLYTDLMLAWSIKECLLNYKVNYEN